jgi:hypothetical protein
MPALRTPGHLADDRPDGTLIEQAHPAQTAA